MKSPRRENKVELSGAKSLVTGAGGFIGSHLVDLYVAPIAPPSAETPDSVLVTMRTRARAQAIDRLLLLGGEVGKPDPGIMRDLQQRIG